MTCEDCKGTGNSAIEGRPCFNCDGTGEKCDVCGESVDACICEPDTEDHDY